jgi:hypothetical protein
VTPAVKASSRAWPLVSVRGAVVAVSVTVLPN